MSDTDIRAGERWATQIGQQLEASSFGVLCLTRENLQEPWILFEAGALARSLSEGAVCPLLLDADFTEIAGSPLNQFQAKKLTKEGMFEMVVAINERAEKPLEQELLTRGFALLWPDLFDRIQALPAGNQPSPPPRPESEVLEELVTVVRALDRRVAAMEIKPSGRASRPSEIRLVPTVIVNIDPELASVSGGPSVLRIPAEGSLLKSVFTTYGLSEETFGTEWFVEDSGGNRMTREELESPSSYASRSPIRVTDLPF